jgi:hypothetical protein
VFALTVVTATVGPEGNSDGLSGANRISFKGNPKMIRIGPTLRGGTDGLAQARRALESVPCVLEGCNSDDQEVHTNVLFPQRQMIVTIECLLMLLCCRTYSGSLTLRLWEHVNSNTFNVPQILFIFKYWNCQTATSVNLISECIFPKAEMVTK